MNIIEIPNAIPKLYQDQVLTELGSDRFTWCFHDEAANSAGRFKDKFSGFSHTAFLTEVDGKPGIQSPICPMLLPILFSFVEQAKLEYNALLRIRVGLFPRTAIAAKHHNPHVDFSQPHQTAVYYVNDSDGDTVVFKETVDDVPMSQVARFSNDGKFRIAKRVSPAKGKMMAFDGRHYHASMHPMNASSRIAITFNFA
jgi:hypothetical protein